MADDDSYRSLSDTVSDTKRQVQSGKDSRSSSVKSGLRSAGASLSSSGADMSDRAASETASSIRPVSYKSGGRVKRTGMARLHKNERVIPAGKRKKVEKMMKRSKMRMKTR